MLDSISSSLHFVGPLIFALSLTGFDESNLPYVAAFFLWGVASHAYGAVQDVIPDRQGGLSSIATFFGSRTTIWIALVCYLLAVLIVAMQGTVTYAVALAGLAYVANCLPYLNITDKESLKVNSGWRRFIWLNYAVGAVVTITLIAANF